MPDLSRFSLRFLWTICALGTLLLTLPNHADAKAGKSSSYNPKYASIVLDAETGKVISSRYPDKIVHPASLTKMMTMYMVFREIEAGRMSLNQRIPISRHAASQSPSKIGLAAGKTIKVKDALGVVVTHSANDIAVALGEAVSGSESAFARDMTKVAHVMGMKDTQFKNASGLPNPGQVTTARDMAILARGLLYHYPQHYYFFGLKNYSFNGRSYHSHNRLMSSFAGMDGLKTGFINASGFNLVASAKRNNRRLIGVVFGGRSWKSRNDHMAELLNAGFDAISHERPTVQAVSYTPPAPAAQKSSTYTQVSVATPPARVNEALRAPVAAAAAPVQPILGSNRWSIQVGAYSTQSQTQDVAQRTAQSLAGRYGSAIQPVIMPFQSQGGVIYRARITGLTQSQAVEVCRLISSCIIVQPNG